MTYYFTPGITWADLDGSAWSDLVTWYNPPGYYMPGQDLDYTSQPQDLGSRRWSVPATTVDAVNVLSGSEFVVTYLISDDGINYTEVFPQALLARYIKTRVRVPMRTGNEGFRSVKSDFKTVTKTLRFESLDTSTVDAANSETQSVADGLGVTTARTLVVSDQFSQVTGASIEPDITETRVVSIVIVDTAAGNFTFGIRDIDTWGQVSTDATINLTLTGLPLIEYFPATGEVRPSL